jgi:hypothetical protein
MLPNETHLSGKKAPMFPVFFRMAAVVIGARSVFAIFAAIWLP